MLCQQCGQEAVVHLTQKTHDAASGEVTVERHFCETCAEAYYANTPGMNAMRRLICLADSYRFKLYELLEKAHPEAFDNHDTEACRRSSQIMRTFLRERFKQDGVEVSGDAFDMLCSDFFGSHHFYTRLQEFNRRKK